jgi:hypothetical protein
VQGAHPAPSFAAARLQVNTQMLEDQVAELEADKGKGAARLVDLQAEMAALKAQLAAGDKERAELEEALGFMEQVGGCMGAAEEICVV